VLVAGGNGVGASWSLGSLWGKPADKQEKVCAATGADARSVALFRIGGIRGRLGLRHCRRTVAQKQQTGAGGVFAFGGMPHAEVADLMQTLGQNVLEEAAHELLAGDAAHPPSVGLALLVADDDGLIVEADDAGVGDGDAEDVAGEVAEHGLLGLALGRAVDDPGLGPGGLGPDQIGTSLLERGAELAAHELGQGLREPGRLGAPGASGGRHRKRRPR
jgi:hypothetical protein